MKKSEHGVTTQYRYRIGEVEFDEARCELRVRSVVVKIERKPLLVFRELLRRANEVVTRQQLVDLVWDGRLTVDQALANAVRKLRQAVEDSDGHWIVTVPRVGYKCIGSVERTAVGQHLQSLLAMQPGELIPGREEFALESQLSAAAGSEVWLARHVASLELRIFKFSRDVDGLAALKRETAVLRLLHSRLGPRHDFVQLLGSGFEKPPFYMECAYGGLDLSRWSSDQGRLAAMSADQRLQLFLQIARAVQAAHSTGVLHKDLKPANVLVAPDEHGGWQVRVTDFGSAKLLKPEVLRAHGITRQGGSVEGTDSSSGTPWYMAPEIIEGATPTVRSDVYSLGLMLYQIVTGNLRRPLTSGWENDIPDELLREDIAAATDGDPQRRLSSVTDLIDRLQSRAVRQRQRNQATLAEQRAANAERALDRAKARRPWLVAAVASLVIGLGASVSLYRAEAMARREAQFQTQRTQEINRFLNRLLRTADPSIPGGAAKLTIEDALRQAESRLANEFSQDPLTKASLYLTLGEAYFGLGNYADALRQQQIGTHLLVNALGEADEITLTAHYQMARTLDMLTRNRESQELLEHVNQLAGNRLLNPSPLALLARWTQGGNALMQMQPQRALREFEAAEAIRLQTAPDDAVWLARVRSDLAWCAVRMRRHAEAIQALDELMQDQYTPERIGITDWAKLHFQYVLALRNLGQHARAIEVARNAVVEIQRLVGPQHYLTGLGWNHVAAVLMADAQWNPAIDAAERAHQIFHASAGEHSQATLGALGDLAILHYLRGPLAAALPRLMAAHRALLDELGPSSPLTQVVAFYRASALIDDPGENDLEIASGIISALDAGSLAAADASDNWELRLQGLRGSLLLARGRAREGESLLKPALLQLLERRAAPWVIAPLQIALRTEGGQRSSCNGRCSRSTSSSAEMM